MAKQIFWDTSSRQHLLAGIIAFALTTGAWWVLAGLVSMPQWFGSVLLTAMFMGAVAATVLGLLLEWSNIESGAWLRKLLAKIGVKRVKSGWNNWGLFWTCLPEWIVFGLAWLLL